MNEVQNLLNSEPARNRLLSTMQRIARNASGLTGEFGSSAFSFAMLVFLVQEARAAGLLQQSSANPTNSDSFGTDAVREVFGRSVDSSIAGVDYSTIAETLARINEFKSREFAEDAPALEDGSDLDLAAEGQSLELELASASETQAAQQELANILQNAVQYAQLSTAAPASGSAAASGAAAATVGAAAAISLVEFMPFLIAGLGWAATATSSSVPTVVLDTQAPRVESMTAQSSDGTLTLVYDEALDPTNLPSPGSFVVRINGQLKEVKSISVEGKNLILTLEESFKSGSLVSIGYTDAAGNQALAVQDSAGNDAVGFELSKLADGYISGAQIYLDANGDGIAQESEKLDGVLTDAQGNFFMPEGANPNNYSIIAVGGVNTDTGVLNTIPLKAPAGALMVNPLTTMVQSMLDANPGMTASQASANVAKSLGLPEGTDLTSYDPISVLASGSDDEKAAAFSAQKAAAQIVALVALASGGDPALAAALMANLANQMSGGAPVNLASEDLLAAVFEGVAVSESAKTQVQSAVSQLGAAESLEDLQQAQKETQGSVKITGGTSASLTESNVAQSATGDLATDSATDNKFEVISNAVSEDGKGKFSVDENGVWTYIANSAFNELAVGEIYTVKFLVSTTGKVTKYITITITGTNDAPTVDAELSGAANEAAASFTLDLLDGAADLDATDTLSVSDVTYAVGDAEASGTAPAGLSISGRVLTVDPKNAAFNYLAKGETLDIVVSYTVIDGKGGTVAQTATITITGTNDAPTVDAELSGAANEAAASFTLDLLDGAADLDATDTLSVSDVTYAVGDAEASGTAPAGLSISGRVLTVDPKNAAFNYLAKGETLDIVVSYTVIDGKGGTVAQTATITITGVSQTVEISTSEALEFYNNQTFFSDDDVVTLNVSSNEIKNGALTAANLISLVTLGVDQINIDGTSSAAHNISALEATVAQGSIQFDSNDTITLDLSTTDDISDSVNGSYLKGSLNEAIGGISQGLTLSGLSGLGVDVIDINGSATGAGNTLLHIDSADAMAMGDAGLEFAAGDTITLDLSTTDDISDSVNGSYLKGSLNEALGGISQGLTLSGLSGLGVDVIDINGSATGAGNTLLHIDSADAMAMGDAGLEFAAGDTITLDVSTTDDISDSVNGSYLKGSLNEAIGGISQGLTLSGLSGLGVDVIDINGSATGAGNTLLHIDSADAMAMGDAGLEFASGDTITLDITAPGEIAGVNGSYLTGSLNDAIKLITGGLTLSEIRGLGVDVIDIDGAQSATLHITSEQKLEMENAGLTWADNDNIVEVNNTVARSFSLTSTDETLADIVGDSLGLSAMVIDQVEIDEGVMVSLYQDSDFALGSDQSLKDLLQALGDSGITSDDMAQSQDALSAVVVSAEANFAIDDTMVSALMDAGLLSANTDSTIEVETDSEHMSTSLSQLADIGADKVTTSQDKVYVDLGDVNDVATLAQMLGNLFDGTSMLFQQNDGSVVPEVGLVMTADQADLAMAIEDSADVMAQLAHVGITELLIATGDDQSVDVTLLGQEYHKIPVI